MGITVISSVSASSLPAIAGLPAGDSPSSDFASLLSGQFSAPLLALPPLDGNAETPVSDTATLTPEQLAELAALNPALASQVPPLPPQDGGQNVPLTTVDRDNEGFLAMPGTSRGADSLPQGSALPMQVRDNTPFPPPTSPLRESNSLTDFASSLAAANAGASGGPASPDNTDLAPSPETAKIAADQPPTSPIASSQGMGAAPTSPGTAAHGTPHVNTHVATPLHDQRWAQDFGDKIVWLAKSDQQTAQISINPPQLGPMQISLSLNGDQASAAFASPHAEVRQVIEDALPRLREMLSSAGISLGDANVGAQLPQQQREQPMQFANGARLANENAILGGEISASSQSGALPVQRGRGLVDLFA